MDYRGYRDNCEGQRYIQGTNWLLNEPLYEWIRDFCASTGFSAVIFFLISAALTSAPALFVYSKYDNFLLSGFVYFTYTGLYLFSFNIVRQFAAAGILLLATYYLFKEGFKNKLLFILLVLCAALFHKSAIVFLLVIFFLINMNNYNVGVILLMLVISFAAPVSHLMNTGIVVDILTAMDYYSSYNDYSTFSISKYSLSNLYMHCILLPFLFNKQIVLAQKNRHLYVFAIKMFVVFLICNNLSANGIPIAYRVGVLFAMYIPIVFSIFPKVVRNKDLGYILIVLPLLFLFFVIGMSNSLVVPDRVLPLNCIWDINYIKFQ